MIDLAHWEAEIAASTPGRFEGEQPETAYFHDAIMNGDGEYVDDETTLFVPTDEEKAAFSLSTDAFYIFTSTAGFIYGVQV